MGRHTIAVSGDSTAAIAWHGFRPLVMTHAGGTWLYRVAVNTCLNRAAIRRPETEPIDAVERLDASVRSPDDAIERDALRGRVQRAIRRLPPRQRATVILRVYHELSHDEIARILGTTVGASKTNLFHALVSLRRLLTS